MTNRRLDARGWTVALCLSALGALGPAACGGSKAPAPAAPETSPEARTAAVYPPPDAGKISGLVSYAGPDPDVAVPVAADPACGEARKEPLLTEKIVGDGQGHLGDVFVYVKSGLEGMAWPMPA